MDDEEEVMDDEEKVEDGEEEVVDDEEEDDECDVESFFVSQSNDRFSDVSCVGALDMSDESDELSLSDDLPRRTNFFFLTMPF